MARARRRFHRAVSQATERLILSYPRADARTGRERLPSLFFVTAAAALAGRPLSGVELARAVGEDVLAALDVDDALDAGERDRIRVRRGGEEAVRAITAGSPFFRHSRLASRRALDARPHDSYDGLVFPLPDAVAKHLDPVTAPYPISASRLATFARCGFQYLLQHVLRLEAALEPEERDEAGRARARLRLPRHRRALPARAARRAAGFPCGRRGGAPAAAGAGGRVRWTS